ncbi:MAG: CPBP family intramembrane glutamic endopeptidase [Terracidiphilus sp.]|jgi:membrane protease YdiL (CAAX protease family)
MIKLFSVLVFVFLAVAEPLAEAAGYKTFMASLGTVRNARLRLYRAAFVRTWIVTLAIITATYFAKVPLAQLGLRSINMSVFMAWPLLGKSCIFVLLALFVLYMLSPILLSLLGAPIRAEVARRLEYVVHITPENTTEKAWWVANSITSVCEELIYRGFVFFACLLWWPAAPLALLVVVSCVLDGLRYAHRPAAALNVFLTGIISCLLFVMFGSLWIAMAVHFLHDIRVLAFPLAETRKLIARRNAAAPAENAGAIAVASAN